MPRDDAFWKDQIAKGEANQVIARFAGDNEVLKKKNEYLEAEIAKLRTVAAFPQSRMNPLGLRTHERCDKRLGELEAELARAQEMIAKKDNALKLAIGAFENNWNIDWNELDRALAVTPDHAMKMARAKDAVIRIAKRVASPAIVPGFIVLDELKAALDALDNHPGGFDCPHRGAKD